MIARLLALFSRDDSPGLRRVAKGFRDRRPGVAGPHLRLRILLAGVVSLVAWTLLTWASPPPAIPWSGVMREAAEEMASGMEILAVSCQVRGIRVDPTLDPNHTCLVGPQYTPLFTSMGQLEAKRTTLSPDVAGLLAYLLREAGVSEGDTVAIGASGSFPGLLLATLAAVRALHARPVTILSLGASSFGATNPDFHLLDLHEHLRESGLVTGPPAAVSLGGGRDIGPEFEEGLKEALQADVTRSGATFLFEADLAANVARRMGLYGSPAVFVNIGGAEANLGVSPMVLDLPPGLTASSSFLPPPSQRGVLFEMSARGVPVIHLLHLRGLALRYGLPWDPIPLPEAGSTPLRDTAAEPGCVFWFLTFLYLVTLAGLFLTRRPGSPAPLPL